MSKKKKMVLIFTIQNQAVTFTSVLIYRDTWKAQVTVDILTTFFFLLITFLGINTI